MANQEYKSKAGRKKKIIQKPLVVSEDGKLCSITVADVSTSSSSIETEPETKENLDLNDVEIENGNEIHAECLDQDKNDEDCKDIKAVKAQPPYEKEDIKEPQKRVSIISAKGGTGRKGKTKKEVDNEQIEPKVKGKRGRKRKQDTLQATDEIKEELKPKAKRAKNPSTSASKGPKKQNPTASNLQLPSPPPTPPPPTETELAEAAAKTNAESARKERLKLIPYYYEEMKEIFDFLCDRGVYWKNDLPKNKRYSNRDTKLLEKEVKKKVSEILESYPKEKFVMEAFEEAERKLKALGERQDQDHDEKEIDIDTGGKLGVSN
ncbi:hypothetical protein AOL_s00078g481 [Orbilia oligospora ATCC 24927]|uniref:Uncharacterized protein n=1 Tax=Arthrobotrys oligospora (strain ATCC 24927 / CBS 115.81 / DSM 1491) TaxID=756982 RepID=G1XC34_ARTOA|nr:hypothetical protein AOL_s00078g481 [Orbilia oligospora ATCC 24927]EGX49448.1 hypothetical protein AOL_s00078g481 [Orbilia oligospora ATCC 24927]